MNTVAKKPTSSGNMQNRDWRRKQSNLDVTAVPLGKQRDTIQIHGQSRSGLIEGGKFVSLGTCNGIGVNAMINDSKVTILQIKGKTRKRRQHLVTILLAGVAVAGKVLASIPDGN